MLKQKKRQFAGWLKTVFSRFKTDGENLKFLKTERLKFLKFSKFNLTSFPICDIMDSALLCGAAYFDAVYTDALLCLLPGIKQFFCVIFWRGAIGLTGRQA